jgi:NADH-quinone oxidoreductase subunit I
MKEYFKNIYTAISTILIGMGITMRHMFTRAVTIQYPHVKPELPPRSRMRLDVTIEDCIGCMQCARACPSECIYIETVRAFPGEDLGETSNGQKKKFHLVKFDIDMGKCLYCAECVFPCPTGCIHMTPNYETAIFDPEEFLQHFSNYSQSEAEELKEKARKQKEAAAKAREAKGGAGAKE